MTIKSGIWLRAKLSVTDNLIRTQLARIYQKENLFILLFQCPVVVSIWQKVCSWIDIYVTNEDSGTLHFSKSVHQLQGKESKNKERLVSLVIGNHYMEQEKCNIVQRWTRWCGWSSFQHQDGVLVMAYNRFQMQD